MSEPEKAKEAAAPAASMGAVSERGGATPPTTAHYLGFRVVRLEFIGSPKPLLAGTVDRTEMLEGIERGAESAVAASPYGCFYPHTAALCAHGHRTSPHMRTSQLKRTSGCGLTTSRRECVTSSATTSRATTLGMVPNARERLVVEMLTRLHRYVRDSGAAAPAAFFEAYDPLSTGARHGGPRLALLVRWRPVDDLVPLAPRRHVQDAVPPRDQLAQGLDSRLLLADQAREARAAAQRAVHATAEEAGDHRGSGAAGRPLPRLGIGVSKLWRQHSGVSKLAKWRAFGTTQTLCPTLQPSTLRRYHLTFSRPSRASRPTTRPSVSHRARSASRRWRARGATRCARATRRRSRWRRARRAWWGRTRGRAPCTTCTACTASAAYSICHLHHSALCAVCSRVSRSSQ
eukprot:scaffold90775_cov51-Phaeocystis_antarctica.AAC.2